MAKSIFRAHASMIIPKCSSKLIVFVLELLFLINYARTYFTDSKQTELVEQVGLVPIHHFHTSP